MYIWSIFESNSDKENYIKKKNAHPRNLMKIGDFFWNDKSA